jgi:restriction endonuclease S subunit
MAVWSEVSFAELERRLRLEAEFYQPSYLAAYEEIRDCGLPIMPLHSLCNRVTDGSHITPDYQAEGIRFLMVRDVREEAIEFGNSKFITEELDKKLKHCKPCGGDVLLTKVGSIGIAAVVPDDAPEFNIFVSLAVIKGIHGVDASYLSTFLNSRFGRVQAFRQAKGITQPDLHLEDIREFLIPLPSEAFQDLIKSLLIQVKQKRAQSIALYAEAENLLLTELGLDTLDLSLELTYERNFSEVAAAERFDAQYFAPRYQRAMKIMARSDQTIGSVAPLAKRFFCPIADEPFNYIEIGSLAGSGHAESEVVMGIDAPSRAQWIVEASDVITSTVRPIRRLSALIEPEQHGFVCSSGFAVLEPRNIPPELLTVYLRLPIVSEVLDLHTTATMYPAIATEVLLNIPISQPSESATIEIVNKVQQSRQAREQAKQLLEDAKRRVEQMILGDNSEHSV